MEPVGLVVGVAGLAGLFSTCLEAVRRFGSWKDYGSEWKLVAAQFEAERILLERWGQAVGLQSMQVESNHHKALDNPRIRSAVTQLLQLIEELCGSLDSFRPSPLARVNSTADGSIKAPTQTDRVSTDSKWKRLKWALGRGEKSAAQVDQFSVLVQKLCALVPVDQQDLQPHFGLLNISGDHTDRSVEDQGDWMNELHQQLAQIREEREAARRAELQKWLLGSSFISDVFEVSVRKHLGGTGDWILTKPAFLDWQSATFPQDHAKVLWIHGPPGFGKTILCARVVQHLQSMANAPVAHCFCSSEMPTHGDSLVPIRAWLAQLMNNPKASELVLGAWMAAQDQQKASSSVIIDLIRKICTTVTNCTFVLDGLDELSSSAQTGSSGYLIEEPIITLIDTIRSALADTSTRLLFVSRDESDIREGFRPDGLWKPVEYYISIDDVRQDVASFSRSIVDKKLGNKSEAIKAEISDQMTARCNGQFLWLRLQENSISRGKNKKQLEKAISETPLGLDRLYERNWVRILEYPESERARAFSLLRWAAFSVRPMTIFEITEALLINPPDELDSEDMPDEVDDDYVDGEILRLCGSLIELRSAADNSDSEFGSEVGNKTIHITHFTIKEYFVQRMAIQSGVPPTPHIHNEILAQQCLHYMSFEHVWDRNPTRGFHWGSLRGYAAGVWDDHFRLSGKTNKSLIASINRFFSSDGSVWHKWRKLVDVNLTEFYSDANKSAKSPEGDQDASESDAEGRVCDEPHIYNPLIYAAIFQLEDTLDYLLDLKRYDINERGYLGITALGVCARDNNLRMAKALLENGADMNITSSIDRTPLHLASKKNRFQIVKLLLDHGATIKASTVDGQTPLHDAARFGALEAAKYLLDAGAAVDARSNTNVTPLHLAAFEGSISTVELLISRGADITLQDDYKWDPMQLAADRGHLEVVRLLLKRGANSSIRGHEGWMALHWAACNGHAAIVELLIESGADVNAQATEGNTPLLIAAENANLETVRALVSHGADVRLCDDLGVCPLHWVAYRMDKTMAEYLLARGADLRARDKEGWTPLHYASMKGQLDLVRLFVRNGAEVTAVSNESIDSLSRAVFQGHLPVAQYLVEVGADLALNDTDGNTLLHCASTWGHLDIVQWLLKRGAAVDSKNKAGKTALHSAIIGGHASTVDYLIGAGANILLEDNTGAAALHLAAREGHSSIAKILVEHGALVMQRNKNNWTPLHSAALNGRLPIVKLLLDRGTVISAVDNGGWTALHHASDRGHLDIVQFLTDQKIDVTVKDKTGLSSLHWASMNGHADIIQCLLHHGADIEARSSNGGTPLVSAAVGGQVDSLQMLLREGANIDAVTIYGLTALLAAAQAGRTEVVKCLLDNGCDAQVRSAYGRNAIFSAAMRAKADTVAFLISRQFDVNTADRYQATPLFAAIRTGHEETVKLLLENATTCLTSQEIFGRTMTYWAAESGNHIILDLVIDHATSWGSMVPCEILHAKVDTTGRYLCDVCNVSIAQNTWYSCKDCEPGSLGDTDICLECYARGFGCVHESHMLVEVVMEDGGKVIKNKKEED